jgi:hypothetical protein
MWVNSRHLLKATGRVGRKPANIYFKECAIGCFDFAHSIVAQSGSFAMVGSRLSQNEEYIQAVKDHILRMIMTIRVQFLGGRLPQKVGTESLPTC